MRLEKNFVTLNRRCLRRHSPTSDVSGCLETEQSAVSVERKKERGLCWLCWPVGISLIPSFLSEEVIAPLMYKAIQVAFSYRMVFFSETL